MSSNMEKASRFHPSLPALVSSGALSARSITGYFCSEFDPELTKALDDNALLSFLTHEEQMLVPEKDRELVAPVRPFATTATAPVGPVFTLPWYFAELVSSHTSYYNMMLDSIKTIVNDITTAIATGDEDFKTSILSDFEEDIRYFSFFESMVEPRAGPRASTPEEFLTLDYARFEKLVVKIENAIRDFDKTLPGDGVPVYNVDAFVSRIENGLLVLRFRIASRDAFRAVYNRVPL